MSSKYYCDRCGKETTVIGLYRLFQGKDYNIAELCAACFAELKVWLKLPATVKAARGTLGADEQP